MKVRNLHSWRVTPDEARTLQLRLRARIVGSDPLLPIRYVAGADVAFELLGSQALGRTAGCGAARTANRAIAGVIVYSFPDMREVERQFAVRALTFPYVPGLLSFREAPALLAAFAKLDHAPDVIFCDAHGYAHPRRFGLACHLGVWLDRPTIGCAKSVLIGTYEEPPEKAGEWAPLMERARSGSEETIGAALRTRDGVRPVYVSAGHRITLERAIELTLAVCDGFRIPRPTREADHYVESLKRERRQRR